MELTAAGLFRIFTGFPFNHYTERLREPMQCKGTISYKKTSYIFSFLIKRLIFGLYNSTHCLYYYLYRNAGFTHPRHSPDHHVYASGHHLPSDDGDKRFVQGNAALGVWEYLLGCELHLNLFTQLWRPRCCVDRCIQFDSHFRHPIVLFRY